MVEDPKELKYTKDHEWARRAEPDAQRLVIGIPRHAGESLGDVVYVELPKVGSELKAGQPFGAVESTKAVSELFAPISGKVVRVNEALAASPHTVNEDPYGQGWMVEVEPAEPGAYEALLDVEAYRQLIAQ